MSPGANSHGGDSERPTTASYLGSALSLPPRWLHMYDDFITKNASQVSQIESALRSLTYIIPGRFRDAEIASESIHSGVQLLSLYHDLLLQRALRLSKLPLSASARLPSAHSRYTRFWTEKSALYRRVALLLQIVNYTQLLCEMAAKRRGERVRWRVVVLIEAVKAVCRLALLCITHGRPLVTPSLPEREPIQEDANTKGDEEAFSAMAEAEEEEVVAEDAKPGEHAARAKGELVKSSTSNGGVGLPNGTANGHTIHPLAQQPPSSSLQSTSTAAHEQEWPMPRTGMSLPSLPKPSDISSYLAARVLTADDIKPATQLLPALAGPAQHAAEVLHILAPLIFALALARSHARRRDGQSQSPLAAWTPWLLGVGAELLARLLCEHTQRQQHQHSAGGRLRATALERDEWARRGWAMGWWAMRGAFYEQVTAGLVARVRRRMPGLVAGILEDYEYLWENYYFSTSA